MNGMFNILTTTFFWNWKKFQKLKGKSKAYRDAYVRERIRIGIPYQIRALREQEERSWTQAELGRRAGKPQNVISRLEDPEYGKLSIQSLLEMASAFDVALMVKFVPFSRFLREYEDVSPASLEAQSFENEAMQFSAGVFGAPVFLNTGVVIDTVNLFPVATNFFYSFTPTESGYITTPTMEEPGATPAFVDLAAA